MFIRSNLFPPAETAAHLQVDATLIIVGDELLCGSTNDSNGYYIIRRLRELGIELREIRVVGDDLDVISVAVRGAHAERRWVFVVGGLGPTHDDLTAAGIAGAFGAPLEMHPEALRALGEHHAPGKIPEGRRAAALLPTGCHVFPDLVSGASGFLFRNVIALPGDPVVAPQLFELVAAHLRGIVLRESSVKAPLLESDLTEELRALQAAHPAVRIGCYPYFGASEASVNVVLRSRCDGALARCESDLRRRLVPLLSRAVPL
jgi:molybdenum cofactor synthesis domain-containing protein